MSSQNDLFNFLKPKMEKTKKKFHAISHSSKNLYKVKLFWSNTKNNFFLFNSVLEKLLTAFCLYNSSANRFRIMFIVPYFNESEKHICLVVFENQTSSMQKVDNMGGLIQKSSNCPARMLSLD